MRRVDLHLGEQRVHAEGPCLIRDERPTAPSDGLIAQQAAQDAGKGHRRRGRSVAAALEELCVGSLAGELERFATYQPARQRATECRATRHQVVDLVAVCAGVIVGWLARAELLVTDGQLECVAKRPELCLTDLLDLMCRGAALEERTECPSLHGVRKDHRGGALLLERELVRGVQLAIVMAAAAQMSQ